MNDITLPISTLLNHIVHCSYNDCGSVDDVLGYILLSHPANGSLFVLEHEADTKRYMVWRPEAHKLYVAQDKHWPSYWAATRKQQKQLEFAALTPKQKLKLKIAEELAKGNYVGVAILERTLKSL